MRDLKIISARAILPIRQVVPVRGFSPVSVLITGSELNKASEVFYNDTAVEQFIVQAPDRILAKVPESQLGRPLNSVLAYSSVPLVTADASISFGISSPARTTQGVERLVQQFLMIFMSTPGSDIFDKKSGGGGASLVGRSTSSSGTSVASALAMAVERTKNELLSNQAKYPGLPLSERLLSASLESMSFDKSTSTVFAKVSLQNMLGNSAEVSIG